MNWRKTLLNKILLELCCSHLAAVGQLPQSPEQPRSCLSTTALIWDWIVRTCVETGGESRVLLNIHGGRFVVVAQTNTCQCCLSYRSGKEWQQIGGGGKRILLKDRAACWSTTRQIAFKGGNTIKNRLKSLKIQNQCQNRERQNDFQISAIGSCPPT